MRASTAVHQATPFAGRLVIASVELTLAAAVIAGAIVIGHDLRVWRDWYPNAYHPWIDAYQQTGETTEPREP